MQEVKQKPKCPECGSGKIQKYGTIVLRSRKKQRYHCCNCGRTFLV